MFRQTGNEWISCGNKFVAGKFWSLAHAKEGFAITDCVDERHGQILEFLIPIFYSEKPTRVMVTIANIIFGAMEGRIVH